MSRLRLNRRQGGFTVLELMIAVALAALFTTLALPSFRAFIQNNRLSGETNELVTALQMARSEAIMRQLNPATESVVLCSSADGATCGGGWAQGWIVAADTAGGLEVIRVWPSPGADFQIAANANRLDFLPSGCFDASGSGDCPDAGDAAFRATLSLDGCTTNNARQIDVTISGSVSSQRTACAVPDGG